MSDTLKIKHPAYQVYDYVNQLAMASIKSPELPIADVWAVAYGDNPRRFYDAHYEIISLIDCWGDRLEMDIDLHPEKRANAMEFIARMKFDMLRSMTQSGREFRSRFRGDRVRRLLDIPDSHELEMDSPLEPSDLQAINEEIDELKNLVRESSIPDELRKYLLVCLSEMQSAVATYEIYGIEPLKAALERYTGVFFIHGNELGGTEDDELLENLGSFPKKWLERIYAHPITSALVASSGSWAQLIEGRG